MRYQSPWVRAGRAQQDPVDLVNFGETGVVIKDPNGSIRITPIAITRIAGDLPWDTERDQSLCGESYIDNNGDMNFRITLEGIIFLPQLGELNELRDVANEVQVISEVTTELGTQTVSFDQLSFERRDEMDTGNYMVDGESVSEPIYTFQLQSKEKSDSSNTGGLLGQ